MRVVSPLCTPYAELRVFQAVMPAVRWRLSPTGTVMPDPAEFHQAGPGQSG